MWQRRGLGTWPVGMAPTGYTLPGFQKELTHDRAAKTRGPPSRQPTWLPPCPVTPSPSTGMDTKRGDRSLV